MASSKLPVDSLPAWTSLNDVRFGDVKVGALGEKGQGIVSTAQISETGDAADPPVLLKVPHEVVLCEDVLDGYAKGDKRLKDLLDAVGPQVPHLRSFHVHHPGPRLTDDGCQVFAGKDVSIPPLTAGSRGTVISVDRVCEIPPG